MLSIFRREKKSLGNQDKNGILKIIILGFMVDIPRVDSKGRSDEMHKNILKSGMLFLLTLIIIFFSSHSIAENDSAKKAVFIDLDGDGFNDNTTDFDNDRFSSALNQGGKEMGSESESKFTGFVSFEAGFNSEFSLSMSKRDKFELKKSFAKALGVCRGESGANFGGSVEGASGSGQTNGCVGGVCIR